MRFTLTYEGDIPPKGGAAAKWAIRTQIDQQMRRLWTFPPLNDIDKYRDPTYTPNDCYLGRRIGSVEFISPVSETIATLVELDILLLSSGQGNRITVRGGDIDNRLKTLLDALRAPSSLQEIPEQSVSSVDGRIYCLMDDDKLITKLNIETDRLLRAENFTNLCLAVIKVKIHAGRGLNCNVSISL